MSTTKWYATLQYDCTKKKKFWYKTFFFYKLHIGYACEITLISRLVSEAKLKCGVGWGGWGWGQTISEIWTSKKNGLWLCVTIVFISNRQKFAAS